MALQRLAAARQPDDASAAVARVGLQLQVAESLEVAQQVVDPLLAHLGVCSHLGRPAAVGARPPEQRHVRGTNVIEACVDDALVDPPPDLREREPQQRADLNGW